MNILPKNNMLLEEELQNGIASELCEKYYTLKSKEIISGLTFEQRINTAHELTAGLKENDFYFYRRTTDAADPRKGIASVNSPVHRMVNLASNDYLSLTKHPAVINAGINAMKIYGTGSGSVPMLAGTASVHKKLEKRLAAFTGYESALTYNSCYAANYGLLTTLLTSSDVAVLDMFVHASIIDGCCHTNKIFFKHNDPDSLKIAMMKASEFRNKLVVVDGVFSMEGDVARLKEIMEVARTNDAWVMVDESHALGVIGENGRGTQSYLKIKNDKADIISCSMGKALGGIGGFIAGSEQLISFLELTSRPFIFSTSIPPGVAAQLIESIHLLESDNSIHAQLWSNIHYFKSRIETLGFDPNRSVTAIIPLVIRDEVKLLNFCKVLHEAGVFVNPIFYPVVPKKKSRIRISITAGLSENELDYALDKIEAAGKILSIVN